jgi:transcriptional regulatory protein LevR
LDSFKASLENFNKFIGYLDKLEKKQKFKSVSYFADILRQHLNSIVNSDGDIKLYLTFCCIECV